MRDRASLWSAWAFAALLPLCLLFAYRDLWALTIVLFLGVLPSYLRAGPSLERPPWLVLLCAFVGYEFVGTIGAANDEALWLAGQHLLCLLISYVLIAGPRLPLRPLVYGIAVATVLVSIENVLGQPIRRSLPPENTAFKDAAAAGRALSLLLLLMSGIVVLTLRQGRARRAVVVPAIAAAASPLLVNAVLVLAATAGGTLEAVRRRLGLSLVAAGAASLYLAPLGAFLLPDPREAALPSLPESIEHRLVIWREVSSAWLSGDVVFGAGTGATEMLTKTAGEVTLRSGTVVPAVSLHAHNAPLQVLYEFGLLGYAVLGAALALGARALLTASLPRGEAVSLSLLISGAAVLFSFDASPWHIQTISAAVLGAVTIRAVEGEGP